MTLSRALLTLLLIQHPRPLYQTPDTMPDSPPPTGRIRPPEPLSPGSQPTVKRPRPLAGLGGKFLIPPSFSGQCTAMQWNKSPHGSPKPQA